MTFLFFLILELRKMSSAFFTLGGGGGTDPKGDIPGDQSSNWLMYKNNSNNEEAADISSSAYNNKGFEIWHHQQQQQNQVHVQVQQPYLHQQDLYASAAGFGVGLRRNDASSSAAIAMMRQGGSSAGSVGGVSCQDCGNQAKKDCTHLRCRTCCKSRGYDCATHVRSTWVPAAKRRERQQQLSAVQHLQQNENPKRVREIRSSNCSSSSAAAPTGLEVVGNFPAEVSSPAMFRCVRVSSVEEREEQYAYQTAVNIGGHVFKGILYDQGADQSYECDQQPLNLIAGGSSTSPGGASGGTAFMDPTSLYPSSAAPLNAFLAGTQFFPNTTRS